MLSYKPDALSPLTTTDMARQDVLTPGQTITFSIHTPLNDVIRRYVTRVINQYDGNITKSAHALGISIRTLQRWNKRLNRHGINL